MNDKQQKQIEATVIEQMMTARAIATTVFGDRSNTFAVETVCDYLDVAEADDFVSDLQRTIAHAKVIYATETPTPEQVFGIFGRIFGEPDGGEED